MKGPPGFVSRHLNRKISNKIVDLLGPCASSIGEMSPGVVG